MRTAVCLIRALPHYRRDAFQAGLERAGYNVVFGWTPPKPGDVLVIWNRYSQFDAWAKAFEAAGALVVVVENGWLGAEKHYAIALRHHNGAGNWYVGHDDRWSLLDIALRPWRTDGEHILVLPQRGIGPDGVAMPASWPTDVYSRLLKATPRNIRVRPHPGKEPHPPLDPDFTDCFAAVTWGSGAAIQAIVAGIPVFHEFQSWIGAPAARFGINHLEEPFLGDRIPMLRRLAWHQWSVDEIFSGEPFRWLLK